MTFRVYLTEEAEQDLQRLEEFLFERALERGDGAAAWIGQAMDEIRRHLRILETNPFTCRRVGDHPFERELVIPFGHTGYVALFEIVSEDEVVVAALRHQREDGYH